MRSILNIKVMIVSVLLVLLAACGGSGGSGSTAENESDLSTESGNVSGRVFDAQSGVVLQNVNIRALEKTAISEESGDFSLLDVNVNERVVVTFSLEGYADQSKIVRVQEQDSNTMLPVLMLPIEKTITFDPMVPQELFVEGSLAGVILGADSLVKADGTSPSGEVVIEITSIDPTVDIDLMPGDMKTDVGAGVLEPIESFGALNIVFRDASGNDLNLSEGFIATIRIPVTNRTGGTPPGTIPLYFYNESTGLWVKEGRAEMDATNSYYEGGVTHFSTWNADVLYEQVRISGCIESADGSPLSNVYVVSEGDDYSGMDFAYTDENGNFSVAAKTNASVLIVALQDGIKTNTVMLSTGTSDVSLDACLVLSTGEGSGNVAASIKLSWGDNPNDLDSHYVGPNGSGIHINYSNQGSLTTFPFVNLDVDDTSSFGPEVITVFDFPQSGIYRYSVYNFSDSFAPGISDSPAIVELNVNGNISLFSPPENEGTNRTWNVFEFVVAEDGSFTINTLNTWSEEVAVP